MLSALAVMRVIVAREPIDMRKGFDGLTAEVIRTIDQDPRSGHLFLFVNRRRDSAKILGWNGTGHFIFYKHLEKGSFALRDQAKIPASPLKCAQGDAIQRGRTSRPWQA